MARMSHLFELRTGYGNRTHIARLRILRTNRYTNPACIFFRPENLNFHRLFSFGIAKVDIFSLTPNFSGKIFRFFCNLISRIQRKPPAGGRKTLPNGSIAEAVP